MIHAIKYNPYKIIPAEVLDHIGKLIAASKNKKDKTTGEYLFHCHEKLSYQIRKYSLQKNPIRHNVVYLLDYTIIIKVIENVSIALK